MFSGTAVALITPFNHTDKSIDYTALGNLIERQINSGIDYIVVMGTTAETPTLTPVERKALSDFIVSRVDNRVPLIIGCGGNDTDVVAAELSRINPADYCAVLSVTPFYNKPTQQGLYAHFSALADASAVPLLLYNVPSRTGVNLASETTLRLANDCKNIVGIKEASGNLAQIDSLLACRPDGFAVISGDDSITLPLLAMGADGVISVIANAFPATFSAMVTAALGGDICQARKIHRLLQPLFKPLSADGNPAGIKALMSRLGLIDNILRSPLVPVSDSTGRLLVQSLAPILAAVGERL